MTGATILECDIGNTYCKWRKVVGTQVLEQGCFPHLQGYGELGALVGVERIRVASVAGIDSIVQFKAQLQGLGVECEVAAPTARAGGVTNAYADPSRLGVDRWLALIAAYNRQSGAVLVLDAGSALTADLVDSSGCHLGGYILPGEKLMKACLLVETGGVRFESEEYTGGLALGCSTADAVNAGVLAAQVGSVMLAIDEAKRQIQQDFAILLTGGGAKMIAEHLADDVLAGIERVPDLVLDGLQWVLP